MKAIYSLLVFIGTVVCAVKCDFENSEDIVHLCDSPNLSCVRKYFSENGKCSVVETCNNNAVYDSTLSIYAPIINVTAIGTNMHVSNMDGNIESFYFDKMTGNLVLSVQFDGLVVYTPDSIFIINQFGTEPIVFREFANGTYAVTLTAVIPARGGITSDSLKRGVYSASLNNGGHLTVGPKFSQSQDPIISAIYQALLANLLPTVKEIFHTKASFDFLAYLQNYICDYGLRPDILHYEYDLTVAESVLNDNNDNDDIFKPCGDAKDVTKCVVKYFKKEGTCSVVKKPNDEPVFRKKFIDHIPFINSSVVLNGATITGLDGEIREFYINRNTGNLVMSVAFESIAMDINAAELIIYQRGQPATIVTDYSKPMYTAVLTAVIPINNGLTASSLKKTFVSTDFHMFGLEIGPNFRNDRDAQLTKLIEAVFANKVILGKELFVTEGPYCFLTYLQKYVCDFGIELP